MKEREKMTTVPLMATGMSEEQQAIFYAQLGAYEKDEVAGVLLALFLGTFGLHHFYLRRNGLGILYLLFFWTGIPALLGFVECFLMPGRVRRYNLEQAIMLAANIRGNAPPPLPLAMTARHCPSCGTVMMDGVRFCGKCGAGLAS
jgi:TM2 domain-containing membrane protein YozV